MPITEKLIQRQINNWNQLRDFLKEEKEARPAAPRPVITVSRSAYSGGRTLAAGLAQRLDMELHDQSIVDRIAQDRKLDKTVVAQMDETPVSQSELWVRGVINRRIFLKDEYHTALVNAVRSLAAPGGAVFLGRGANLILDEQAAVRVRVVAPWRIRLERLMKTSGLSRLEARALLDETDRKRDEFIRRVFRVEPGDPSNFDLTLNSARMSPECMIETVLLQLLNATTGGRACAPTGV
jgi:cytidylate kinase